MVLEVIVEVGDLDVEELDACRDRGQRFLGRGGGVEESARAGDAFGVRRRGGCLVTGRAEAGAGGDEGGPVEAAQLGAQPVRGGDDQGFELGQRGGIGVDRVRLALIAARLAIRAVNLDHGDRLGGQEPGQPGTVRAGCLPPRPG